jgi:hypothetical protein
MREIKSPADITFGGLKSIFLGGSIEMGAAEDWQTRLVADLVDYDGVLLNPRRDNWDPTWVQSIHNPEFKEQVNWELDAMACSSAIVFYFDPNTMSPITLMELGLAAASDSTVIVCCPDGFWRKGNVEIICDRFKIPLCNTYYDLVGEVRKLLT